MDEKSESLKDKSAFLFDVIKRYDHYIATTNFKVALMMSFLAAIILGITIRIMSLTPLQLGGGYVYYAAILAAVLTITLSLAATINLLRTIFPNTKTHDGDKSLIFFEDVASSRNGLDGYKKKIVEATPEKLLEDLSSQTFIVAEIINEKFRILKLAVTIIIYGVIPSLAACLLLLIIGGAKY